MDLNICRICLLLQYEFSPLYKSGKHQAFCTSDHILLCFLKDLGKFAKYGAFRTLFAVQKESSSLGV